MEKCKDCCYYDNGICRINPPTVGFYTSEFAHRQRVLIESAWPSVNPEKDWCGKFKSESKAIAAMKIKD